MHSTFKMNLILITFIFISFIGFVYTQDVCDLPTNGDRRPDKHRLKIVTFNMYWLFLENWKVNGSPWSRLLLLLLLLYLLF